MLCCNYVVWLAFKSSRRHSEFKITCSSIQESKTNCHFAARLAVNGFFFSDVNESEKADGQQGIKGFFRLALESSGKCTYHEESHYIHESFLLWCPEIANLSSPPDCSYTSAQTRPLYLRALFKHKFNTRAAAGSWRSSCDN